MVAGQAALLWRLPAQEPRPSAKVRTGVCVRVVADVQRGDGSARRRLGRPDARRHNQLRAACGYGRHGDTVWQGAHPLGSVAHRRAGTARLLCARPRDDALGRRFVGRRRREGGLALRVRRPHAHFRQQRATHQLHIRARERRHAAGRPRAFHGRRCARPSLPAADDPVGSGYLPALGGCEGGRQGPVGVGGHNDDGFPRRRPAHVPMGGWHVRPRRGHGGYIDGHFCRRKASRHCRRMPQILVCARERWRHSRRVGTGGSESDQLPHLSAQDYSTLLI
mmetsp:Transcript_57735/g.132595  ORF Transcript_57735/g.132595 Transcript_57735/m.132595 type:complete len:279 (+) Transcript_57735:1252-2088(+)